MVSEEYFKKLEARYAKYYYLYQPDAIRDSVALAREIAKHTSNEGMISRIVNSLRRMGVLNIEGLMEADIDEIAKIRNMGHESLNIIRTIKGLPTLTYAQAHPYRKYYRIDFFNTYDGKTFHKDFSTLRELTQYFNDESMHNTHISYISEIKEET